MFTYEYLSTVDTKGRKHNYKVPAGDTVPIGHVEVSRRVARVVESVALAARYSPLR